MADDDSWSDIYEQIAADILSNKDYKINAALQQKTAEKLISAVNKGLSAGDIESDRSILGKKLLENIYVFSAAKSATQMKYYRDMMLGEDGAILGKDSFVKKIADTGEIFNKTYLSAEYENAYYSTIMADQWNRYADDEILEYSTAGDSHVRASHKLLDKYTAPKAAPFWKNNYPPNGWGCRCAVVPGKIKNVSERQQERWDAGINSVKIENEKTPFYSNVGLSAQIFDEKKHPYFKIFSKPELEEIKKDVKQNLGGEIPKFTPKNISDYEDELGVKINKNFFDYLTKETDFKITNDSKGAYYLPSTNTVHIPIDERRRQSKWKSESVVYHEFGHASDWQHDLKMKSEVIDLMNKYRKELDFPKIDERLKKLGYWTYRKGHYDLMNKVGAAHDTLMSLNPNYGMGHDQKYWKIKGNKEAEFIAHAFENKFAGNEVFKKVMPDLYKESIELIEKIKPK